MTINSKEYTYLKKRIEQIKKNFRFKPSLTGITPLQSDRLRGLRLLCHAEFEDYFESVALRLAEKAEEKWQRSHVANYNLASLFINHEKIETNDTHITKAGKIISDYKKEIKRNHGIKEENIKKLFFPLGYVIDDFDSSFISTISTFGSLRGETAHTSAKKTTQPLDLQTEINLIDTLIVFILDFETVIKTKPSSF